jgi:hypothetical protein
MLGLVTTKDDWDEADHAADARDRAAEARDQAAAERDIRAAIRDALEPDQSELARAKRQPAADDRSASAEDRTRAGNDRRAGHATASNDATNAANAAADRQRSGTSGQLRAARAGRSQVGSLARRLLGERVDEAAVAGVPCCPGGRARAKRDAAIPQ